MFVDPDQINPYNKILGGPKTNDDIHTTWVLLRIIIRKNKIKRIYGNQKEE